MSSRRDASEIDADRVSSTAAARALPRWATEAQVGHAEHLDDPPGDRPRIERLAGLPMYAGTRVKSRGIGRIAAVSRSLAASSSATSRSSSTRMIVPGPAPRRSSQERVCAEAADIAERSLFWIDHCWRDEPGDFVADGDFPALVE